MPTATAESRLLHPAPSPTPAELLGPVQRCLAAYAGKPADPGVWAELQGLRFAAAEAIAALNPAVLRGPGLDAARALRTAFAASGAADEPAAEAELAWAGAHATRGWPGLYAAMVLVPAWQSPALPRFDAVPLWCWPDYTAHLFQTVQGFTAVGQAEAYAAHYLRRLDELVRVAEPARGSAAVRAALAVFAQTANAIPLYFSRDSLRRHAELRGRLLRLVYGPRDNPPVFALPREGRRLRVGFVNRHFSPQTETYTTLPSFEQLDPERFEVLLFAHQLTGSPLEAYCRKHAQGLQLLPPELPNQLELLRGAALDVVVFGTNVTAVVNEVTQLALHRVAPLQVVNNSSCITSGLPEIDLYVSGELTESAGAAAHFTERLGLLRGPAHAFNYQADRQEPATTWTRSALGLPEDAVVFVSAANYFKVIPEMQHTWARLLAQTPGSRLLLHPFNPNWSSSYPVKRFQAGLERVMARHGVAADRVVISTNRFPSRADVKALLAVGDVYLDTFPFGGVNSLVDPLELGLPVVAWEGGTMRSRMGAALLRQLQLPQLIAADEDAYLAIATGLATDASARVLARGQVRAAMAAAPLFLDALAASDLFGGLLEAAFDELVALGPEEFRRTGTPVTVPPGIPVDAPARQQHARALLAQGRGVRAVDYLLGAVDSDPNNGGVWFDLAIALRDQARLPQALQALESSLRADPSRVDAWNLMAELADRVGAKEIADDARALVRQLAPAPDTLADFAPLHLRLDR